jgi:general nucleoside transport system ATP-binding protein
MVTNGSEASILLEIENLTKRFGDVVANDRVSLTVRRGEVHCLLGENGAGKSTLAECLFGYFRPDSGTIRFKGKTLQSKSPRDAITAGIGMVHQHFMLAPKMSVIENIVVGTQTTGIIQEQDTARETLKKLCEDYGLDLDLDAKVVQLPVGQRQWVEILKALYLGVELLILDEPTAVLTPQESERLFETLAQMKEHGLSIILITHKLREVIGYTDQVTVLRHGKNVGTVNTAEVDRAELIHMMVGRTVDFKVEKTPADPGDPILELRGICVGPDDCPEVLSDVSLVVHRKEIIGIAGVAGNGQKELFDVILGLEEANRGKIFIGQEDVTNLNPQEIMSLGVATIPPDRIEQGLLMGFPIKESLILGLQHKAPFLQKGFLRNREIDQYAKQSINDYQIRATSGEQITGTLSGGNLQRVILARELSQDPQLLIASSPTRGLDVAAIRYVHERLVALRDAGLGVLLISEDLDEILNVSDRVAVIYRGSLVGEYDIDDADREQLGLAMAGFQQEATEAS